MESGAVRERKKISFTFFSPLMERARAGPSSTTRHSLSVGGTAEVLTWNIECTFIKREELRTSMRMRERTLSSPSPGPLAVSE